MANKYRGEAELLRDGKPLKIQIGSMVLCKAEQTLGKPLSDILSDLSGAGFRVTTLAALVRFAVSPELSESKACELIDECGYEAVNVAIQKALAGSMGLGGDANPPEAGGETA